MNIFTYITGIAIGNMAGEMIIHRDVKLIEGITGMALWSALVILIEVISLKGDKARTLLDGEPSIVIKRGQINLKALKKLRLNLDDLTMLLRINRVFSILEVEYAIMESNGELSVLKKTSELPATKQELGVTYTNPKNLACEIIMDGKIVERNLKEMGKSLAWLNSELKMQNVRSVKEVIYAQLQGDGSLYIQKY